MNPSLPTFGPRNIADRHRDPQHPAPRLSPRESFSSCSFTIGSSPSHDLAKDPEPIAPPSFPEAPSPLIQPPSPSILAEYSTESSSPMPPRATPSPAPRVKPPASSSVETLPPNPPLESPNQDAIPTSPHFSQIPSPRSSPPPQAPTLIPTPPSAPLDSGSLSMMPMAPTGPTPSAQTPAPTAMVIDLPNPQRPSRTPTPAWTEPVVARKPQVTIEAPISSPSPPPPEAYVRPRPHHVPQNATITVQPFAVQQEVYQGPNLPRVKPPQLTRHRHSTNPTFALGILQDIATIVEQWQADLEEIHLQIQDVYMDGPIVDGWLEAETTLDGQVQGYRLCGLDEQGRMWARPCPPDQLPSVSVAIARYQHLRQLSTQKQQVEKRLKQLGEKLALLHSRL